GSSGALTPDADSGVEDGATGEDGAAPMVCAPGKVEVCPCPGGGQGAQACRQDGTGFEPCECAPGDGGAGGAGGSGGAPDDAGPDAPPDTTGWRWWCMRDGDAECSCSYGAVGNENVASCAPITDRTCCYRVHIESRPSLCHCIYDYPPNACDWKAGYHGGTVTATCP